ncbi:MAG: DUF2017 family protein [Acidimicrobiia bacterium]
MSRFTAAGQKVLVALEPEEVAILSRLPSLLGSVGASWNDPARDRLNPEAYPGDTVASREFSRLTEKELVEARSSDRERFADTLDRLREQPVLRKGDAAAWVRVLGEARLVLAARHGMPAGGPAAPDEQPSPIDVDDLASPPPDADPELMLVDYLGVLQDDLVGEMLTGMGEGT